MHDRHPLPSTPASDAVLWVLGNQLQPHRGRWLGRRLRSGPWVFLGLSGLAPDVRMQGLFGREADMPWKNPPSGRQGLEPATREAQPILRGERGPTGPAGPPGRDAIAERAPGGPIPGRGAPGGVSGPTQAPAMPAPIGMFIFQQPAPGGRASPRPRPAAPLAGILDGRTGGMTMAGMAGSPVSAGGPPWQQAPGVVPGAISPMLGMQGTDGESGAVQRGVLPGSPTALEPEPLRTGRPTAPSPSPAVGDASLWGDRAEARVFRDRGVERYERGMAGREPAGLPREAPPRTVHPPYAPALGVLARTLALLPGIGWRPPPEGDDEYPIRPRAAGGQKSPALPAPDPVGMLPLWNAGGIFPAGPGPEITVPGGIPRPPARGDIPLPASHPRRQELAVMVSGIEQAVARQVDKALKEGRRSPPPERAVPQSPGTGAEMDSDRMARRLADRIRRLAQDDRFRRGRLR